MAAPFDPSEIIGKQGWELARCVEDYFAGWVTYDPSLDDEEYEETVAKLVRIRSVSCQTPDDWTASEAAQEAPKAEPRRAPPLKRIFDEGTMPPRPGFDA